MSSLPEEASAVDLHWDTVSVPEWDHLVEGKYIVKSQPPKFILRPILGFGDIAVYLSDDSSRGSCVCPVWGKEGKKRGIPCEHLIYVKRHVLLMDRLYVGKPYAVKIPQAQPEGGTKLESKAKAGVVLSPPQEQSGEKAMDQPPLVPSGSAPQAQSEQTLVKTTEHPKLKPPAQEQAGEQRTEPKLYTMKISKWVGDTHVQIVLQTKDIRKTLREVKEILSSL